MADKPVRFHPEAEQEYLSSLGGTANEAQPALDFEKRIRAGNLCYRRSLRAMAEVPVSLPEIRSPPIPV